MLPEQKEVIQKLRDARKSHKRWVSRAQIMISGVPVVDEQLPLNETECDFGRWYYGPGQALNEYSEFRAIEKLHSDLHRSYLKIFNLLMQSEKPSFWHKLIGKSSRASEKAKMEAQQEMVKLNDYSEQILELLQRMETRIKTMSEEEFQQVYLIHH